MRQETDTIDIIDDLRYAINELAMTNSLNSLILTNNNEITSSTNSLGTSSSGNRSRVAYNANYKNSFERIIDQENRLNFIDEILRELNLEC